MLTQTVRALGVPVRGSSAPACRILGNTCSRGLATSASYDAVIVGAGVIGNAIALELSRKGWRTLNVDTGPGVGFGSTAASCGIIRTMYSVLDSVKLAHEGYHLWSQWADHIAGADEAGAAPFTKCIGAVPRCESSAAFMQRGISSHDTLGIPYEIIDNAAFQERFPWMDINTYGPPVPLASDEFGKVTGSMDGALMNPTTGYVSDTVLATQNLLRASEAHGGAFRFKTTVTAVLKSQGRVAGVQLSDGSEVSARVVINASGPWSMELNRLAFSGDAPADDSIVKTRPMRVEVAYPQAPPEIVPGRDDCWVGDFDTGVYFRTATAGRLCIGSIEPVCDDQHDLASVDEFEEGFGDPWQRQVYRAALRIPTLGVPNSASGVSHMYDKSDDFTPIYDKTALPGFYTAIGTSGNQFKNCGVVGQLMAHLVEACENGQDHDADPVQFQLPLTKEILNVGAFSRLRCSLATSQGVLG